MPKPRAQDTKRGGFKVGPKLGKGVYKGHGPPCSLSLLLHHPKLTELIPLTAKKIKETLIHKAKVKKSYYKDLVAEGYATGPNGGDLGVRRTSGKKVVKPMLGEQRRGPGSEDGDEDEEMSDSEREQVDEEAREEERRRVRRELEGADEDKVDSEEDSEEEEAREKGKGRAPKFVGGNNRNNKRSQPPTRDPLPDLAAPSLARRPRPPPLAAPLVEPPRPAKRPRLSEEEVAAIREKKSAERREWGKKGRKGQPKLGGRVEQLLGRIQRSMT
jgi:hypothetical protein